MREYREATREEGYWVEDDTGSDGEDSEVERSFDNGEQAFLGEEISRSSNLEEVDVLEETGDSQLKDLREAIAM